MTYSMSMGNENRPNVKILLEKGWRTFKVNSCEAKLSKSGNEMFVVNITDKDTSYAENIYLVATEGKRWLLKEFLTACGIIADAEGKYNWDIKDILEKEISGFVDHEPNEYINRNGDTIKTTIHRINKFEQVKDSTLWGE